MLSQRKYSIILTSFVGAKSRWSNVVLGCWPNEIGRCWIYVSPTYSAGWVTLAAYARVTLAHIFPSCDKRNNKRNRAQIHEFHLKVESKNILTLKPQDLNCLVNKKSAWKLGKT